MRDVDDRPDPSFPEDADDARTRLAMHEFLLEVLYANWFASAPEERARRMKNELLRAGWTLHAPLTTDLDVACVRAAQARQMRQQLLHMLDRIEAREHALRTARLQGAGDTAD